VTAVVDTAAPTVARPRARRSAATLSPAVASALWAATTVGVLAAWLLVYGVGLSSLQEQHSQHVLYAQLRQQFAKQLAPPHLGADGRVAAVHPGQPVALITAPGAGLRNVVVVQGTRATDLRSGPGHLPGTVLPGENGPSWILGRGATFGAPFRSITSLHAGDRITVTTQQGIFTYVVNDVRGPGDRIESSPDAARLTLVTSVGSGWRSGWAPTRAVYVDATLSGKAAPVTPIPQVRTAADGVMRGDAAALVPLFLWLLALVSVALLLVWARLRWGPWQAWIAGLPVVTAALWGAADAIFQLLPNLV
jgi:sortase A